MEFCKEPGIAEKFRDFCGKRNLESEMIQTVGPEGVTAASSSSLEAIGARQGERPATAYTTPSRPPIGRFMAEASQNHLFSTNEGTQIQMREAAHDGEASTSSPAPPSHHEPWTREQARI
ncbi:hypothetical protein SLEP1_g29655 [Rubroshorea leprosula]|uniref:Uncharacterized protein n=1 Tax=Rubroshorea leprosula TaxID=152421 RepID=A0AAV5K4M9_9ROSI|nr:hypothetical protein SLEP1_g29655 [Rubroshorea leprosula]